MERAAQPPGGAIDPYGSSRHKQVYLYGTLDPGPSQIVRNFGMAWGVGGWLLGPFLERIGPDAAARLRARVAGEITTTFASKYSATISLADLLRPSLLENANRRATGEKLLIDPQLDLGSAD
jgi:NADPH2:quinone reductase